MRGASFPFIQSGIHGPIPFQPGQYFVHTAWQTVAAGANVEIVPAVAGKYIIPYYIRVKMGAGSTYKLRTGTTDIVRLTYNTSDEFIMNLMPFGAELGAYNSNLNIDNIDIATTYFSALVIYAISGN